MIERAKLLKREAPLSFPLLVLFSAVLYRLVVDVSRAAVVQEARWECDVVPENESVGSVGDEEQRR